MVCRLPKIDAKCESGFITPSVEEIAEGIANRDKVRIVPYRNVAKRNR